METSPVGGRRLYNLHDFGTSSVVCFALRAWERSWGLKAWEVPSRLRYFRASKSR